MNRQVSKNTGRWSVAVLVCAASMVAAFVVLELAMVLVPRTGIRWADAIHVHLPADIFVSFLSLLAAGVGIAVWTLSTVFAVGFAIHSQVLSRWRWGFSVCLLLTAALRWPARSNASIFAPHIFILASGAVLIAGFVLSFRHSRGPKIHFLANVATLVLLTLPCWISLAVAPPQPPTARKLWSATLQKTYGAYVNTMDSYGAGRHAVFAGERILVVFDAGFANYVDNRPVSKFRLLSLDAKSGLVRNSRDFIGHWWSKPYLYATDDGHAILEDGSITSLNFDLTPALPQLSPGDGRFEHISPDGSTLAWEMPGTTLLDSHTLRPLGKHLDQWQPTSVSTQAAVTDTSSWADYPDDLTFITLADENGQRLLFHSPDDCGGHPEFLTDERILLVGCARIRILGVQTGLLREAPFYEGWGTFAGVSQNGKRFALHRSDERGDPEVLLYEHFIIYDTDSLTPISIVRVSNLPERQSWSAFSPDGHMFVAGSPDELSLYEIP